MEGPVLPAGSSSHGGFLILRNFLAFQYGVGMGSKGKIWSYRGGTRYRSSYQKCEDDLAAFVTMCEQLGVPLAQGKTYSPADTIQFLGINLDAVHMEARLPEDKLAKARDLLVSFLGRQTVTLRELQAGRHFEFCMFRLSSFQVGHFCGV